METSRQPNVNLNNHPENAGFQDIDSLVSQLPEAELWQLLQDLIDRQVPLRDATVSKLDDRMQSFLFMQDYVENREARIAFARSPRHMAYLRDAAGSRNVSMTDEEFGQLVAENDSVTLACFARSEQMQPHHLMYIERSLALRPHGDDLLASSYDTRMTLKKAREMQGNSRELVLMRLAKAALEGSTRVDSVVESRYIGTELYHEGDPRMLWQAYRNLQSLDLHDLRELAEQLTGSSEGLVRTSGRAGGTLH